MAISGLVGRSQAKGEESVNYLATHVGCDDCGSSDALSVSVNDK